MVVEVGLWCLPKRQITRQTWDACRLGGAHEATPRERRREHQEGSPLQPCDLVPRACFFKFHQGVPENGSCDIDDMHDKIKTEKSNKNDGR